MLSPQQALSAVISATLSSSLSSQQASWIDDDFVEVFLHETKGYWYFVEAKGIDREERLQHIRVAIGLTLNTIKNMVRQGKEDGITVAYVKWLIKRRSKGIISRNRSLFGDLKKKADQSQKQGGEESKENQRLDGSEERRDIQEEKDHPDVESMEEFTNDKEQDVEENERDQDEPGQLFSISTLKEEDHPETTGPEELLISRQGQQSQWRFAFLGMLDGILAKVVNRRRFKKDYLARAPKKRVLAMMWRWSVRGRRSEIQRVPLDLENELNEGVLKQYCRRYGADDQAYYTIKSYLRDDMLHFWSLEMLKEICADSTRYQLLKREYLGRPARLALFEILEKTYQTNPETSGRALYDTGFAWYCERFEIPKTKEAQKEAKKKYKRLWLDVYRDMVEFTLSSLTIIDSGCNPAFRFPDVPVKGE